MFGPIKEGTLEIVNASGVIVGHGFVEGDTGVLRQRWVLFPEYVSPPLAEITMRSAKKHHASVDAWISALARGLWREGSRYVEATCAAVDEQIEIHDLPVLIYQRLAEIERLVGFVITKSHPGTLAGEPAAEWRTFSGIEVSPVHRYDEHWRLLPSYVAPPRAAIHLRAPERVTTEDLEEAAPVVIACATFNFCPELAGSR